MITGKIILGNQPNTPIPVYKCYAETFNSGPISLYSDAFNWTCGTSIRLVEVLTGWEESAPINGQYQVCSYFNPTTSVYNCKSLTPKCKFYGPSEEIIIVAPLVADFAYTSSCVSTNAYQTINFSSPATGTGSSSGGLKPYSYSWTVKNASTNAVLAGPTSGNTFSYTPTSGVDIKAILTVTDASTPTARVDNEEKTITPIACCSAPSITTHPQSHPECSGLGTSFTVTPSGGNPAPTSQWQIYNGSSWENLTNTGVYSNVTNTTLNISDVTGLNGKQYRVVLTSGVCTPVNSNAATLSVVEEPGAPVINTPTHPTCLTPTGSFTVQSPNSSYTYILTGPSPATTTQSNNTGSFSSLASGAYSLTANNGKTSTFDGCTSVGTLVTIDNQPGGVPAAKALITQDVSCSSSAGKVRIVQNANNQAYDALVYEFSNNGTTYGTSDEFTFTAGGGYNLRVRRISDHSCTASATCVNSSGQVPSASLNTSAIQEQRIITQHITMPGDEPTVKAFPNPYNDRIRFVVSVPERGQGSLEVHNMLGQKVKTIHQGLFTAGTQTFELQVPNSQRSTLIYVLRLNGQQVTGKMLQSGE
ncbi:MAG: hypothetical protein H0U44_01440 [Flavisolibacter sp.]|nr:hypothetical protein [Flavisolibacter sp.]